MIFIDSNIPMYLIGADHPCNYQARRLPERSITGSERLVTSAAVFQAILHRFTAIRRKDAIQPAFDALRSVVDEIFAIEMTDVERAREIQFTYDRLSSRDALHVAVMERHNVRQIMSFDNGFDGLFKTRSLSDLGNQEARGKSRTDFRLPLKRIEGLFNKKAIGNTDRFPTAAVGFP